MLQLGQLITDGMMQEALNKGTVALLGGGVAWLIRKEYYERKSRGNKIDKTYKTLFGVDEVDTMEGVVEIIEAHEDDIDKLFKQVQKGKDKRKEIERSVETLRSKVKDRHEK